MENSAKQHENQTCPRCGSSKFETRKVAMHVGQYCAACGRWIRFLAQHESIEVMPFGRHAGTRITNLATNYLRWILENVTLKGRLLKALEAEFERRGTEAAA